MIHQLQFARLELAAVEEVHTGTDDDRIHLDDQPVDLRPERLRQAPAATQRGGRRWWTRRSKYWPRKGRAG